jgi:hypothetical protein
MHDKYNQKLQGHKVQDLALMTTDMFSTSMLQVWHHHASQWQAQGSSCALAVGTPAANQNKNK